MKNLVLKISIFLYYRKIHWDNCFVQRLKRLPTNTTVGKVKAHFAGYFHYALVVDLYLSYSVFPAIRLSVAAQFRLR
jgi:hypothetical protein